MSLLSPHTTSRLARRATFATASVSDTLSRLQHGYISHGYTSSSSDRRRAQFFLHKFEIIIL
jgi:hypothetical protein